MPFQQALAAAVLCLHGQALEATPVDLHLRVARWQDGLLVDLGGNTGRVVDLASDSWQVFPEMPGPLFRRTAVTKPLSVPARGGPSMT